MNEVDFYFDYLSPYSYLAWQWVRKNHGQIRFNLLPAQLGKVIHHYETKGPAEIAPKRDYLFKDCLRFAKLNNIPFQAPGELPFNSSLMLRSSLKSIAGEQQLSIIDMIYNHLWAEGGSLSAPEELSALLSRSGNNGEIMIEKASAKESRVELKNVLLGAFEKGVFGLPSFVVKDELFWGNDSIGSLEMFLKDEDPLDLESYNFFKTNYFVVE